MVSRTASYEERLRYYGKLFSMGALEYKMALRSFSASIMKRDNYECQMCNSKEDLSVHHIIQRFHTPKLSFVLNNGITLCNRDHSQVHGKQLRM